MPSIAYAGMRRHAVFFLLMIIAGVSHSEDGTLTTKYISPSWWEQNVRIRAAPRVQASIIRFLRPGAARALAYCPKETQIRVLARTLEKERVQQWTNYWYYVEITAAEGMMQRYGWMFGEFISFSEEHVREEELTPRPWDYHSEDLPASPESEETDPAMYEYD